MDCGNTESAQANFEINFYERLIRDKPDFVDALIPLAAAYTRNGQYDKGLKVDRLLSRILRDDPIVHYNLACSLSLTGKTGEAIKSLKRSIRLGYCDFRHLENDPDLRCLHDHPEFEKIVKKNKSRMNFFSDLPS